MSFFSFAIFCLVILILFYAWVIFKPSPKSAKEKERDTVIVYDFDPIIVTDELIGYTQDLDVEPEPDKIENQPVPIQDSSSPDSKASASLEVGTFLTTDDLIAGSKMFQSVFA